MTPLDRAVAELSKLPGIGKKTALRLVFHILRQPKEYAQALASSLVTLIETTRFCSQCFHLTNTPLCPICSDIHRDSSVLCVVEESRDLLAIDRGGAFRGLYHVLHGSLSPLDGIGPDQLKIDELLTRARKGDVREVILATNPTVTGDATALYIAKLLKPAGLRVTRIAMGLPAGSDIEYADQVTLARALESRHPFVFND